MVNNCCVVGCTNYVGKKKEALKKHVNRFNPKVLCCIQVHLEVCGKLN